MLNLENPKYYTTKIQYLKLNQTSSKFSDLADKYKVREYIIEKVGEDKLTKLYWVGEKPEEIPYETLPNSFVIKCNHGCGYNIIVPNKNELDKNKIIKKLNQWLKEDYYKRGREMQYKNISKKIIIEELLIDKKTGILMDYKVFCFNGEPEYIQLTFILNNTVKVKSYDLNWNSYDIGYKGFYPPENEIEKPGNLDKMIEYSRILAKGFKFVRVDFYEVEEKLYFGEMTFTPGSGFTKYYPNHDELDKRFGEKILI